MADGNASHNEQLAKELHGKKQELMAQVERLFKGKSTPEALERLEAMAQAQVDRVLSGMQPLNKAIDEEVRDAAELSQLVDTMRKQAILNIKLAFEKFTASLRDLVNQTAKSASTPAAPPASPVPPPAPATPPPVPPIAPPAAAPMPSAIPPAPTTTPDQAAPAAPDPGPAPASVEQQAKAAEVKREVDSKFKEDKALSDRLQKMAEKIKTLDETSLGDGPILEGIAWLANWLASRWQVSEKIKGEELEKFSNKEGTKLLPKNLVRELKQYIVKAGDDIVSVRKNQKDENKDEQRKKRIMIRDREGAIAIAKDLLSVIQDIDDRPLNRKFEEVVGNQVQKERVEAALKNDRALLERVKHLIGDLGEDSKKATALIRAKQWLEEWVSARGASSSVDEREIDEQGMNLLPKDKDAQDLDIQEALEEYIGGIKAALQEARVKGPSKVTYDLEQTLAVAELMADRIEDLHKRHRATHASALPLDESQVNGVRIMPFDYKSKPKPVEANAERVFKVPFKEDQALFEELLDIEQGLILKDANVSEAPITEGMDWLGIWMQERRQAVDVQGQDADIEAAYKKGLGSLPIDLKDNLETYLAASQQELEPLEAAEDQDGKINDLADSIRGAQEIAKRLLEFIQSLQDGSRLAAFKDSNSNLVTAQKKAASIHEVIDVEEVEPDPVLEDPNQKPFWEELGMDNADLSEADQAIIDRRLQRLTTIWEKLPYVEEESLLKKIQAAHEKALNQQKRLAGELTELQDLVKDPERMKDLDVDQAAVQSWIDRATENLKRVNLDLQPLDEFLAQQKAKAYADSARNVHARRVKGEDGKKTTEYTPSEKIAIVEERLQHLEDEFNRISASSDAEQESFFKKVQNLIEIAIFDREFTVERLDGLERKLTGYSLLSHLTDKQEEDVENLKQKIAKFRNRLDVLDLDIAPMMRFLNNHGREWKKEAVLLRDAFKAKFEAYPALPGSSRQLSLMFKAWHQLQNARIESPALFGKLERAKLAHKPWKDGLALLDSFGDKELTKAIWKQLTPELQKAIHPKGGEPSFAKDDMLSLDTARKRVKAKLEDAEEEIDKAKAAFEASRKKQSSLEVFLEGDAVEDALLAAKGRFETEVNLLTRDLKEQNPDGGNPRAANRNYWNAVLKNELMGKLAIAQVNLERTKIHLQDLVDIQAVTGAGNLQDRLFNKETNEKLIEIMDRQPARAEDEKQREKKTKAAYELVSFAPAVTSSTGTAKPAAADNKGGGGGSAPKGFFETTLFGRTLKQIKDQIFGS